MSCAAGCGFFGNPDTENLCSKCFKSKMATFVVPKEAEILKKENEKKDEKDEKEKKDENEKVGNGLLTVESKELESTKELEQESKRQKKRTCFSCNKKLKLSEGFTCACGNEFCGLHRFSDKHGCTFDYKKVAEKMIEKNNPIVTSTKIEKI